MNSLPESRLIPRLQEAKSCTRKPWQEGLTHQWGYKAISLQAGPLISFLMDGTGCFFCYAGGLENLQVNSLFPLRLPVTEAGKKPFRQSSPTHKIGMKTPVLVTLQICWEWIRVKVENKASVLVLGGMQYWLKGRCLGIRSCRFT